MNARQKDWIKIWLFSFITISGLWLIFFIISIFAHKTNVMIQVIPIPAGCILLTLIACIIEVWRSKDE